MTSSRARPPARGVEPCLGHAAADARSTPTAPCSSSAAPCTPTRSVITRGCRRRRLLSAAAARPPPAGARHLPRCAAAGEGSTRVRPAGERVRDRLVPRRADGRGRRGPGARAATADLRGIPVALLRPRHPGGRSRARAESDLHAGIQARRERVGRPVPSRGDPRPGGELDRGRGRPSGRQEQLLAETRQRIDEWNRLGRDVCAGFVEAAERVAAPA